MNLRGMSFDQMPELDIPLRFFLTAPLFALLLGALLLWVDPILLTSRWTPFLLAATHLITLGFMLMVMVGALFQVLPVVVGVSLPHAKYLSILLHAGFSLGILGLATGFLQQNRWLLGLGGTCLMLSLVLFLASLLSRFSQMRGTPTSWAIRLSALSLLVTLSLGLSFVVAWVEPGWFPTFRHYTNLHLMWGLCGWTLLLVMGVSFQIIPMFYVTADYPRWVCQGLPFAVFTLLVLISVTPQSGLWRELLLTGLALAAIIYAASTLWQIERRKRKSQDITLWFWNTAMTNLILAGLVFLARNWIPQAHWPLSELLIAVMILVGFAMSLITGMLLKIVPFLVWLNLQQAWVKRPTLKMPLSNMHQVIPGLVAKKVYWLFVSFYVLALLLMLGQAHPLVVKLSGMALLLTYSYLAWQLVQARGLYRRLSREMQQTPPRPGSES